MKKLTAKVAATLSKNSIGSKVNTFQGAIDIILVEAQLGKNNCFIDGELKHLKVINKELKLRGFKTYIESCDNVPYLNVEW